MEIPSPLLTEIPSFGTFFRLIDTTDPSKYWSRIYRASFLAEDILRQIHEMHPETRGRIAIAKYRDGKLEVIYEV